MDYSKFDYDKDNDYLEDHDVANHGSYKYYISLFEDYIKQPFAEIGAGVGTVSSLLLENNILDPDHSYLIEPNATIFPQLTTRAEAAGFKKNNLFQGTLSQLHSNLPKLKTLLYFNVLEHIENDISELRLAYNALDSGGRVIIFVPAIETLYSPRDLRVGHYRRYYKEELVRKLSLAGFEVEKISYTDFIGAVIWFFRFKLIRSDSVSNHQVALYNTFIVPINKFIEKIIPLPYGKNCIAIAKKIG